MSTALPMSGESHGVPFGFVGCSTSPAGSIEVEPQAVTGSPAECLPETKSHRCSSTQLPLSDKQPASKSKPSSPAVKGPNSAKGRQLRNRVAAVREQQGISQRTMARRLEIDVKAYQALEAPEADLSVSQLATLQAALDVPLIDLLEDSQALSRPVAERAKMIKVMKTAVALRETPSNARVERMVQTLCDQLIEVMPELAEVSGWPQFGSRRGKSALGKALSQPISTADLGLPD